MSDELVKRLRANTSWGDDRFAEAADRIDALTAERDRAEDELYELQQTCITLRGETEALTAERDGLLRCVTDNHVALCRAEKAEAERDRLRVALRGLERASTEVASCGARTGPHWLKLTVANLSARAALKGETNE